MKMYMLSDNVDTLIGMRLSGVEGEVLHEEQKVKDALVRVTSRDDIAVVMMTETLVDLCRNMVYDLKLNLTRPLIIEIPDRHGNGKTSDSITRYVQEAIGVKLD